MQTWAGRVFAFLSAGTDTKAITLWSRFEYRAAYDSEVRVELPLIPSARAAPPSGPSEFASSLWAQNVFAFLFADI